ncbi:hypothetical protein D9M68_596260 [compost metagenome]
MQTGSYLIQSRSEQQVEGNTIFCILCQIERCEQEDSFTEEFFNRNRTIIG